MTHGMFRRGRNGWAISAALNWMKRKQVCYDCNYESRINKVSVTGGENAATKQCRRGKGFCCSIIISRVCNSITDRFQNTLKNSHNECTAVRKPKTAPSGHTYTPMRFYECTACVVSMPDMDHEDTAEQEKKKRKPKRCLCECHEIGVDHAHTQCIVNDTKDRWQATQVSVQANGKFC